MARSETSAQSSEQGAFDNLRIVLIGTTGTGKSATGNSLIGESVFKAAASRQSVTKECSVAERERFGTRLVVVDTPGIFDTSMSKEQFKIQLIECTHLACPGVHAFLFLMKIGQRNIANKDEEAFHLIKELLGEGFLSRAIVIFTAKETIEEDGQSIDEYISTLPEECRTFMKSCKGGAVAVSNIGIAAKEQTAEQITNKVRDLVQQNDGGSNFYNNILFDKQNEEINERMQRIIKKNHEFQNQINEVQAQLRRLIQIINDGIPTEDQTRRRRDLEKQVENVREKLVDRRSARFEAYNIIKFERKLKNAVRVTALAAGTAAYMFLSAGQLAGIAGVVW